MKEKLIFVFCDPVFYENERYGIEGGEKFKKYLINYLKQITEYEWEIKLCKTKEELNEIGETSTINLVGIHYTRMENPEHLKREVIKCQKNRGTEFFFPILYSGGDVKTNCKFGFLRSERSPDGFASAVATFIKACWIDNWIRKKGVKFVEQVISVRDLISSLSLLKHRIAHNFLSIDIDLQGIAETEEERRINYLLDMYLVEKEGNFEWRNVGHYQEKLKLAQYYVLKSKIGKKRESGKELKTIEEIYEYALEAESDEEKKGEINRRWKNVKELATGENENELYKNTIAILKDLDDAVDEVRNNFSIRSKEKEKITAEAKEIIENNRDKFHKLNQMIKQAKSGKILEFHKWFIELDDSIDKLREALRG